MAKRYYWLKLQKDFFNSKRIKKLRRMAGGDTYTIIYLKMQLLSMETDGVLQWSGLENDFASELALDLDESPDDVAVTLHYLLSCGLAETADNVSFFLPWVKINTGSETASAQRVRDFRERKALQSNNDVTQVKRDCSVEKEIEKESEIEKEKDIARARACEDDEDDGFEAFWSAYPRKSGDIKSACFEYQGVIQSGVSPETLLEAVRWQAEAKGQFMPNAERWLRNKGWTEKKPEPKPVGEKKPKRGFTSAADYVPPQPPTMEELDAILEKI